MDVDMKLPAFILCYLRTYSIINSNWKSNVYRGILSVNTCVRRGQAQSWKGRGQQPIKKPIAPQPATNYQSPSFITQRPCGVINAVKFGFRLSNKIFGIGSPTVYGEETKSRLANSASLDRLCSNGNNS